MKKETWLIISYWTGAILDFIVAAAALMPSVMGVDKFVHPMGTFSAVAASWGILLIFASKKPLERRWVLIPTIIVVVLLLTAVTYSTVIGLREVNILIAELIVGALCITLWTYSYIISGKPDKK